MTGDLEPGTGSRPLPDIEISGTAGQVLKKTADGVAWQNESGGSGGTEPVPRIAMTASDTAVTLEANKLYVFPEMASLEITLAAIADSTAVHAYHFRFTSGASATSPFTIPGAVSQPDGFTVDANHVYEVSILENCMTVQSWEVAAQ